MEIKIIPFDIELAKKIQAGEIKGKIKYSEYEGQACDAEIIKFDVIADKSRAKPNSTLFRTIVAIIDFDDYQGVRTFNTDGYGINNNGDDTRLFLVVPDDEPQFKPFDKVLCRDEEDGVWKACLFSHEVYGLSYPYYVCGGNFFKQCIPYEGNQELVGTTDKPKED